LGAALFASGETERVIELAAPQALALAEGVGDRGRAFRACRLAIDCLFALGAYSLTARSNRRPRIGEYRTWAERAGRYAEPDSIECVYADLAFAHALLMGGQHAQPRALRLDALTLARKHGDAEAMFSCAVYLLAVGAPQHWGERLRLAEECAGWPRQGVGSQTLGQALQYCGTVQLAEGERAQAEELWRQLAELAERTRVATVGLFVAEIEIVLATVDGRLEEALVLLRRFVEIADESGAPDRGRAFRNAQLFTPALYLGRADVWLTESGEPPAPGSLAPPGPRPAAFFIRTAARALCLAQLGRLEEARAVVGPVLNDLETSTDAELRIAALVMLLQAAIVVEDRGASQALAARVASVAHLIGETGIYTCVARHLADAAALAGDRAVARAYYMQALDSASKTRFRPELALSHLGLAELLLEGENHDTWSEALEHVNLAIPELQDMHMQPALERALALSHRLDPAPVSTRSSVSDTLTAREREIVSLMAGGLSNRQIADRLVISEGTVEVHVKHVLSKLGYRSRSQVVGWFDRQHHERTGQRR
jgi:DNA-binding NarL/FixJ family response regulator